MSFKDHLLVVSLVLFIVLFIIFLYFKIRQFLPKQEICWFCHKPQTVTFSQRNSYNCIHCQQYNGFAEDGNYNKVICGQYETSERRVQYCRPLSHCYSNGRQLCSECNVSQEIKAKLLSEFIPFNETNFGEECDEYIRHLDSEYKLCSSCEAVVKDVLSEPINSYQPMDKTCNNVKTNAAMDSVFAHRHRNRCKQWLIFVSINVLEIFSIFCPLIALIFSVKELEDKTEITFVELSETMAVFVDNYSSNTTLVIMSGLMSSMIALMIFGKNSLRIFSQILWFVMISTETPLILRVVDKIDSLLLRPILLAFLILFAIINTSFRLFNTKSNDKQMVTNVRLKKRSMSELSLNNEVNVSANGKHVKSFVDSDIKSMKTSDQSIGEQIKTLRIVDTTVCGPNVNQRQRLLTNERQKNLMNISINSSFICGNGFGKNIILPAKFHYESIAQTSWVSPFKPDTSQRKDLNSSPYCQQLTNTSLWISQNMSGLLTPPPSATPSINSDYAFANRYPLVNSSPCSAPALDYQRNSFYNSNDCQLKSRPISRQYIRGNSIGNSSEESDSYVSEVSGSLSSLTIERTANKQTKHGNRKQTLCATLGQSLVFAFILLLLFCFVIFLSLPIVLKSSCDLQTMSFQLSIESLPQNNVCIK